MKVVRKTYIENSRFMEFVDEMATQLTELNFHDETFVSDETDELTFTEDAQEFYNERYDEVENMLNVFMGVYSDNELNE